eukprot:TRINITY_DN4942_c4_g1_i2.p1 TRINITY_DN4942_c4_g1~~TRINITY_DN4942_c4_g1_i2.p1  ORF type:complete len:434 (-),score=55.79 TRINITY_DN4942_c4_g1_i2:501-1802(-)
MPNFRYLVVFLILVSNVIGLTVLEPIQQEIFTPTSLVYAPDFVAFENYLFFLEFQPDVEDVHSQIIVQKGSMFIGKNIQDKVRRNPSGIIFTDIDDYPGNESILRYRGYTDRGVPIAFMRVSDYENLVKISNNHTVPIKVWLEKTDSLWKHRYIWVVQIILCGLSLFIIWLTCYKLYYHILYKKGITITLAIMLADICGNLLRFFHVMIDPFFTKGIFYARTQVFFISLHWPFTLLSIMLIFLYWTEIQSSKVKATSFIIKYKFGYLLFSSTLFIFDVCVSMIVTSLGEYELYILTCFRCAGFLLLMTIIMVAFIIKGIQLIRILKTMKERNTSRIQSTKLILASCIGIIIYWVGLMLMINYYFTTLFGSPLSTYPVYSIIMFGLTYLGCDVSGFFIILAVSTRDDFYDQDEDEDNQINHKVITTVPVKKDVV